MKTFTVCLYDGSVNFINSIVATKIVNAETIDAFDPVAEFYDVISKTDHCTEYQNRITKRNFKVYYTRALLFSDTIHSYDFGSYTRFICVVEGDHTEDIKSYFNENAAL